MFVQVIESRTAEPDRLAAQMDRWVRDLRPGATGYLGSTGGVTDDGEVFLIARFDTEQSARSNSDRPEQGEWWADTESCFDGDVRFTESSDVDTFLAGGSDDAGFVQVMKIPDADRAVAAELDAAFAPHAASWRPDLIGGLRIWTGASTCLDVNYFTSEAEARSNESAPPPQELEPLFDKFSAMMANVDYIDLRRPMIVSA